MTDPIFRVEAWRSPFYDAHPLRPRSSLSTQWAPSDLPLPTNLSGWGPLPCGALRRPAVPWAPAREEESNNPVYFIPYQPVQPGSRRRLALYMPSWQLFLFPSFMCSHPMFTMFPGVGGHYFLWILRAIRSYIVSKTSEVGRLDSGNKGELGDKLPKNPWKTPGGGVTFTS